MTNYNERLDEILDTPTRYIHQYGCACTKLKQPKECDCEPFDALADTKQALTSLIKELVAEAKPNKKPQFLCQVCDKSEERGYNQAVKEFEKNLLKELEG